MLRVFLKKFLKRILILVPFRIFRVIILRLCGYSIGNRVYVPSTLTISDIGSRKNNVVIKDRASIGPNVLIITDSSPNYSKLIKLFPVLSDSVIIEEDVWIGANVTILPGIIIGKCSLIGAGSVVTKSVPPYSIAFGNPAKVVRTIDEKEIQSNPKV